VSLTNSTTIRAAGAEERSDTLGRIDTLQLVIDGLDYGTALFDLSGKLVWANATLESLLDLASGELQMRGAATILDAGRREDGSRFLPGTHPIEASLNGGPGVSRLPLRLVLHRQDDRWLELSCRRCVLPSLPGGEGVVATFADVTPQRLMLEALAESERRFRAMAESASHLIALVEADGRAVYVNRSWSALTGRDPEALLRRGWLEALHPGDRERHLQSLLRALRSGEPFECESRISCGSGHRWFLHRGTHRAFPGGRVSGLMICSFDLDDRRREEARRRLLAAATELFAQPPGTDVTIAKLLTLLGTSLDCAVCGLWTPTETESLRLFDRWSAQDGVTARPDEELALAEAVRERGEVILVSSSLSGPASPGALTAGAVGLPVRLGSGELLGVLVVCGASCHGLSQDLQMLEDLTQRLGQFLGQRRAEERTAQAGQLRLVLLERLPVSVLLIDREGLVITANEPRHLALPDLPRTEEAAGRNYLAFWDAVTGPGAETARVIAAGIRGVLKGERPQFEQLRPEGDLSPAGWYRMIVTPLPDLGGAIITHVDITEARRAEAALAASETRYRLLSRATSEAAYEWDIAADRWSWSEGLGRLLGYEEPEFTATWWVDRVHPEDRDRILASLDHALGSKVEVWTGLYRFRRADGGYCHVADRGYIDRDQDGKAVRMIGAVSDITERRKAELRLQRSEAALAAAQTVAQVGSWELDLISGVLILSTETKRLLGLEGEQGPLPSARLLECLHPDDHDRVADAFALALRTPEPFALEFRIRRPNGCVREIHTQTQITRNMEGVPVYVIGAVRDVTGQREAERQLYLREHRLRLLNSIATGIRMPASLPEVASYVLRQLHACFPDCRLSYSTVDEAMRLRVVDCVHPPHVASVQGNEVDLSRSHAYLTALLNRGPIVIAYPDEDPNIIPVLQGQRLGSATVLTMPLGLNDRLIGVLAISSAVEREWTSHERDMVREVGEYLAVAIAEVRATEERERAVRDLAASEAQLRDLAHQLQVTREKERRRIAREIHDVLGQALTALRMEAALLLQRLGRSGGEGRKLLELIDETIDSVQRLSADLRPSILDDLDLAAAIQWEVREVAARAGLDYECQLPEELGALSPEQSTAIFRVLQESLTNVVRHARAERVYVRLTLKDGTAQLEVRDNGVGFDGGASDHSGSLGLLGMRERARALGGTCSVDSVPGGGTRLLLHLPLGMTEERDRMVM